MLEKRDSLRIRFMGRVFVMGAAIPNGGTFMAYQLGLILQRHFGYESYALRVDKESWDHDKHTYDELFPFISVQEMESTICNEDILIANPSFSHNMFGLRLPGKKICYVQGFTTFSLLDLSFDHYIACSTHVQNFLAAAYCVPATIIRPFIEKVEDTPRRAWIDRPERSICTYLKGDRKIGQLFFERFKKLAVDHLDFVHVIDEMSHARASLLEKIASCRFFLSLSPAEGFGLVPLEAMALGTIPAGFDGFGGRDYFRSMENSAVVSYPYIDLAATNLLNLMTNPLLCQTVSEDAVLTASAYRYERFRDDWIYYFSNQVHLRQTSCVTD